MPKSRDTQPTPVVAPTDTQLLPKIEQVTQKIFVVGDDITQQLPTYTGRNAGVFDLAEIRREIGDSQPDIDRVREKIVASAPTSASPGTEKDRIGNAQIVSLDTVTAIQTFQRVLEEYLKPHLFRSWIKKNDLETDLLNTMIHITMHWLENEADGDVQAQFQAQHENAMNVVTSLRTDIIEQALAPYMGKHDQSKKFQKFLRDYEFEILAEVSKRYAQQ